MKPTYEELAAQVENLTDKFNGTVAMYLDSQDANDKLRAQVEHYKSLSLSNSNVASENAIRADRAGIKCQRLSAQVGQLRDALTDAAETIGFLSHHLRGRMGEAALMDMAEKADDWSEIAKLTPTQCLAERDAEVAAKAVEATIEAAIDLGYLDNDAMQCAFIRERMRQQAKAGE